MALKPPPIGDVLQQIGNLVGNQGLKGEADKTLKALVQSALTRLDLVNREEFDAQAAILDKARQRMAALETELETLTRELENLEKR
jgi:BMFP domain-containing protein YqiC